MHCDLKLLVDSTVGGASIVSSVQAVRWQDGGRVDILLRLTNLHKSIVAKEEKGLSFEGGLSSRTYGNNYSVIPLLFTQGGSNLR